MKLVGNEPSFAPWKTVALETFAAQVLANLSQGFSVIAIDGRSAGGKTTLADKLAAALPSASVVHTDDIAWHHSMFDWTKLALEHVLIPFKAGKGVSYTPTAWLKRERKGSIEVPKTCRILILEGAGSAQLELMNMLDYIVWVQSDFVRAETRGIARDGGDEEAINFWHHWMDAELTFQAKQKPWERADVVVCGTPAQDISELDLLVTEV